MVNDIAKSRIGSIGGSEAKMLHDIGRRRFLTPDDKKRIKVYLGLEEFETGETSPAAQFGYDMEAIITKHLSKQIAGNYVNEQRFTFETNNINMHCSLDLWFKIPNIYYEIKTSKFTTEEVYNRYIHQLMQQNLIISQNNMKPFTHRLIHYKYDNLCEDFDENKLTVVNLNFTRQESQNWMDLINAATITIYNGIVSKEYLKDTTCVCNIGLEL